MSKRQQSPCSETSEAKPPIKKVREDSEPKSPAKKATKISSAVKAEMVDILFSMCTNEASKAIAEKVGLTNQQIKSQFAGGGRANLRKNIVDALRSGKLV